MNKITIIDKVAEALSNEFAPGIRYCPEDKIFYEQAAKVAIEAMRDLVKCDPNGNREEDLIVNRYINAALKE